MSLSLYSFKSRETSMLNNNGYRIEVKPDENDVMKVFITRDDGEEVLFNELVDMILMIVVLRKSWRVI